MVAMARFWANEAVRLAMIGLSAFSALVLVGGYAYSGSLVPTEPLSSDGHSIVTWLMWLALVLILVATLVLWGLAALARRRR